MRTDEEFFTGAVVRCVAALVDEYGGAGSSAASKGQLAAALVPHCLCRSPAAPHSILGSSGRKSISVPEVSSEFARDAVELLLELGLLATSGAAISWPSDLVSWGRRLASVDVSSAARSIAAKHGAGVEAVMSEVCLVLQARGSAFAGDSLPFPRVSLADLDDQLLQMQTQRQEWTEKQWMAWHNANINRDPSPCFEMLWEAEKWNSGDEQHH